MEHVRCVLMTIRLLLRDELYQVRQPREDPLISDIITFPKTLLFTGSIQKGRKVDDISSKGNNKIG